LVQASSYCTSACRVQFWFVGPGGQSGGQGGGQQSSALMTAELTSLSPASPTVFAAVSSTMETMTMLVIFM